MIFQRLGIAIGGLFLVSLSLTIWLMNYIRRTEKATWGI